MRLPELGVGLAAVGIVLALAAIIVGGAWLVDRRRARLEALERTRRHEQRLDAIIAETLTGVPVPLILERTARTGESPATAAAMIAETQRLAFVFAVADARLRLIARHPELGPLLDPDRHR